MASTILSLLTLLFAAFLLSTATATAPSLSHHRTLQAPPANIIAATCKASFNPTNCQQSLVNSGLVPPNANALQVIQAQLNLILQSHDLAHSLAKKGTRDLDSELVQVIFNSRYRVEMTAKQGLTGDQQIKDGRAWLSAALAYEYDTLKEGSNTSVSDAAKAFINSTLIVTVSDALNMLANYDVFRENMSAWGPPKTERDGYWDPANDGLVESPADGVPKGLTPNVTVCATRCNFSTVQEAVNAAPENRPERFVIGIKAGVYKEQIEVPLLKFNVVFVGDGVGKTVITGDKNVGEPGVSTMATATVRVFGDGFMARDITFENTGVPRQAVAFIGDADHIVVESCVFRGNQDTLCPKSLRQYYKLCVIYGNVDFIFGNAAAIFNQCQMFITPRPENPEQGERNTVTAHGRQEPGQTTGFVFQTCSVNGTAEYMSVYGKNPSVHENYLGRPWKDYSRTVFIGSILDVIVSKGGWYQWEGYLGRLNTLYYGEFGNIGAGADTSGRVKWSNLVPQEHLKSYSVINFIQGDRWIPRSNQI